MLRDRRLRLLSATAWLYHTAREPYVTTRVQQVGARETGDSAKSGHNTVSGRADLATSDVLKSLARHDDSVHGVRATGESVAFCLLLGASPAEFGQVKHLKPGGTRKGATVMRV